MRGIDEFADLDDDSLKKIGSAMSEVTYTKDDMILKKGDVGRVFYVIRFGTVKVTNIGSADGESRYADHVLSAGDYFGERALMTGEPRAATITCMSPTCTLLTLSSEDFQRYLGDMEEILKFCSLKRVLLSIPVFSTSKLASYEIKQIVRCVQPAVYNEGASMGKDEPCIYLIDSGTVTTTASNGVVNIMGKGDYFGGEDWLDDVEKTTAIASSPEVKVQVLKRSSVFKTIESKRLGRPISARTRDLQIDIDLDDLSKIKLLGIGSFGRVWLVKHTPTSKTFALKQMDKALILKHHQEKSVIREKSIMASLHHPFIVQLVSVFSDSTKIYMLLDLLQGGELFSVIHTRRYDGIPCNHASFYAQCLLMGLEHMHSRSIVYRDLKPENIMIDSHGYPVLVDLGFAKVVQNKTYTMCGTPEYLAPEIILSKGHDKGVDCWAFGVLIYEMIYGITPFFSSGIDQVTLFKRIVQGKFAFPPGRESIFRPSQFCLCISKLTLVRNFFPQAGAKRART
jgi:CRP-like cAMP-binding protein/tRNA A-37 threonylcarbamoyl transferase component Bud32